MINNFRRGMKDGMPIALGYFPVSFTFGMMAVSQGMPAWFAIAVSMVNLTSAGQFAGLPLILSAASAVEMAVTQFIINLRYSLMSLSLSQKVDPSVSVPQKLLMSFGVTDEVFAVASVRPENVGARYFYGLMATPYLGWTLGTACGALLGAVLPELISSSLSIAIYGMFIAIILPDMRKHLSVSVVVAISAALSCAFKFIPALGGVSSGFVIIICAVVAAALGALIFPVAEKEGAK